MTNNVYITAPPLKQDCFVKLNFSERQLTAMRALYYKYFEPVTADFKYIGYAITVIWDPNLIQKSNFKFNDSFKSNEATMGYNLRETVCEDPLWQEFKDILPFMSMSATITILPPMSVMHPHIDRPTRLSAIYFPISGCTNACFSDCYHLPKNKDPNVRNATSDVVIPQYSYTVTDNAYMMNTQEWHGVRNTSKETRIAVGWNPHTGSGKKTYFELRDILTKLNYIQN